MKKMIIHALAAIVITTASLSASTDLEVSQKLDATVLEIQGAIADAKQAGLSNDEISSVLDVAAAACAQETSLSARKKTFIKVTVVLLVLVAAGVGGYYLWKWLEQNNAQQQPPAPNNNNNSNNNNNDNNDGGNNNEGCSRAETATSQVPTSVTDEMAENAGEFMNRQEERAEIVNEFAAREEVAAGIAGRRAARHACDEALHDAGFEDVASSKA